MSKFESSILEIYERVLSIPVKSQYLEFRPMLQPQCSSISWNTTTSLISALSAAKFNLTSEFHYLCPLCGIFISDSSHYSKSTVLYLMFKILYLPYNTGNYLFYFYLGNKIYDTIKKGSFLIMIMPCNAMKRNITQYTTPCKVCRSTSRKSIYFICIRSCPSCFMLKNLKSRCKRKQLITFRSRRAGINHMQPSRKR